MSDYQQYKAIRFKPATKVLLEKIDAVMKDFVKMGYTLTVRQLYYQMVTMNLIPNNKTSYNNFKCLVNDGRMAGVLDWDAIEDRMRSFVRRQRWNSGRQILEAAANSFHMDMWKGQDYRVFVIIEKDALVGVLNNVCHKFDVPLLAARGYPSSSVLREFALTDIRTAIENDQVPVILHLGDHDPSGIDMTRDLLDRVELFRELSGQTLLRIALTMDQIKEQSPPPNPAKTTDARFAGYRKKYGTDSWELDALKPQYLENLVEEKVLDHIDSRVWNKRKKEIEVIRKKLITTAKKFKEKKA